MSGYAHAPVRDRFEMHPHRGTQTLGSGAVSGGPWWRASLAVVILAGAGTFALRDVALRDVAVRDVAVRDVAASRPSSSTTVLSTTTDPPAVTPTTGSVITAPAPGPTTTTATTTRTRVATLAFTGDIITHLALGRAGRRNAVGTDLEYDFGPSFELIAPTITSADLAICHLESPLAFEGRFSAFPLFNGPFELAQAIADAGFDGCSVASNHAYDQQAGGVDATLDVLDASGLQHAGTARTPLEAATVATYNVKGIRVAHLSYTYGLNGFELTPAETWRVNIIDPAAVSAEAKRARDEGAEFVVASLHWGSEYLRQPTRDQLDWAAAIASDGYVDMIIGHHAHVLQPITTIGDTFVLYGLGNFLSNQEPKCCTAYSQDGAVVEVQIGDMDGGVHVVGFQFTPTWVDRNLMQVVPVVERLASNEELPHWIRASLEASLERTLDSLGLLGAELSTPR